jgi:uncharacterized protein
MASVKTGGADEFLAFLTKTLKPWVAKKAQIDPARQTLFGHSLGGLLVLHALFEAPQSFNVYIAASPSIRFSNRILAKEEPALESNPARTAVRVLVTVGGLESHPSHALADDYRRYYTAHPEAIPGMTPDQAVAELFPDDPKFDKSAEIRALVDRLVQTGVKADFAEFPGEEHSSAAVSALNRGIPFALRPAN